MKLFIGFIVSLGACVLLAHDAAAVDTIGGAYPPTTVSISTSAWTKVPAGDPGSRRVGLYVSLPATLNANMAGLLGSCSGVTDAVTIRPIEIVRTEEDDHFFPLSPSVCFYLLSLHTAAESVHVQEVR